VDLSLDLEGSAKDFAGVWADLVTNTVAMDTVAGTGVADEDLDDRSTTVN
jgi:hypothetical protein